MLEIMAILCADFAFNSSLLFRTFMFSFALLSLPDYPAPSDPILLPSLLHKSNDPDALHKKIYKQPHSSVFRILKLNPCETLLPCNLQGRSFGELTRGIGTQGMG